MTARLVRAVDVPAGERVLDLLPALRRALAGDGPALLPVGVDDPRAAAIARALDAGRPLASDEDDPADPTALVIATSGSTGTPKGVLLSANQLAASAAATEARLGGPGSWLLALPAYHIAGMQVLLRAARAGTEPIVMGGETPFTAAGFVAAARRLPGPRRYVSLVPTQLRRVLDDADGTATAAELFDAVLVGGSAIPEGLLREARAAGVTVVTTYGMSETCGGCVYDGEPLDGVSVGLTSRGAIVLTGPMVARGYRGQSDGAAFISMPRGAGVAPVRSFVTSDTGEITSDGRVLVFGRLDDMIISGGVNIAPGLVEEALRALPGIRDALVVGVPDARWGQAVAALLVPGDDAGRDGGGDLAAVRAALEAAGSLPRTHVPHRVRAIDALPQLASGKPDRAAARRLFD